MSSEQDKISAAIERGALVAAQIDEHRLRLDHVLTGLVTLGGISGMKAVVAGAVLRIEAEQKKARPKPGS